MSQWQTVIGLEVHVQLATHSKLFSGAATAYGAEPNCQASEVDLALPGVLPVLNREAVRLAVRFGLAVSAHIDRASVFARKNYFYPDLPKGYQISQFESPIVAGGKVDYRLHGGQRQLNLTRAHLEEDAGKSMHDHLPGMTAIDLNRAGTPLLEIVSEPDLRSAEEAVAYLKTLHRLVRYLGISDGNMQEGSFRCDANISLRRDENAPLGTRTEIKNLNSFRYIDRAIHFEVSRQAAILEDGGHIVQETRLYDAGRDETRAMRSKEEANDYRYFPDPDLLPVVLDEAFIAQEKSTMPELPLVREQRFVQDYGLNEELADQLAAERGLADYFESTVQASGHAQPKAVANWLSGEWAAAMNRDGHAAPECPVSPVRLAGLLDRVADGTLSGKLAKQVFDTLWCSADSADSIIAAQGLQQMNDSSELESMVDEVLQANPAQVAQYREGKTKLMGFFVGQLMKASQGKANPAELNRLLKSRLAP